MAALAASVSSFASFLIADIRFSILPRPIHAPIVSEDDDDDVPQPESSTSTVVTRTSAPPYGQRNGWKPSAPEDFGQSIWLWLTILLTDDCPGDGGAYPECHVAQYPLEMGRKKVCPTNPPPETLFRIPYLPGLIR
jgi:SNW domain-containing protein 1